MIKKAIDYVRDGIWNKKEHEYRSGFVRWLVRQAKVLIYTGKGFGEHDVGRISAALTFYTLMSVVPIAALIFGVVKGFGFELSFEEYLYMEFPQYKDLIDLILDFANNLLARTKGGLIASVAFVTLVWAVMRVFGNAEKAFNNIWEVRKSRSLARKLSDYLSVVFIAPILWIISNSLAIYIKSNIADYSNSFLLDIVYAIASLATIWVMFTFLYTVMPNTKVRLRSAIPAGIIAGTAFQLFQVGYVYAQTWMTSYNAIYGSFAALPLFLIWMQSSWQILLAGGELTYAYQNISKYEQERESLHMSYDHRQKVLVASMQVAIRHFLDKQEPVTSEIIAGELNMPLRIVRDVVFDLERAGLLSAVQNNKDERINLYIPSRDVHAITISDVVDSVELKGQAQFDMDATEGMERISVELDRMRRDNGASAGNVLLMDIK